MKKLLLLALLTLSISAFAQDTTKVKTDSSKHTVITSFVVASKNFWRGNVYGNNAPMLSANVGLALKNGFEVGAVGTTPINGNRDGYGIWMELYASQTVGKFKFTVDDYYFFNAKDSLNDYGTWDRKNTQHLIETRVKYSGKRFSVTGSYVVYAASSSINNLYLEAEYFLIPELFSVTAGGVFGQSYLNFYDKGGVTHFGFTGYRNLVMSKHLTIPMSISLMSSPNYKNTSKYPAFTQNPINLIVSLTF